MKEKYQIVIIGLVLALFSFIMTLSVLNQTHYANGWDGYYYVMQIHTFFRDGVMHSSDRSFIYPFFIGLNYLCSDEILTVKIGTSILSMIFTISCYYTVLKQYNQWILATVVGVFIVFSPMTTFFVVQFPKNLMGLCFLVMFISMIDQKNYKWALLFFIGSFFTHRSSAIIALLYICNIQIGIFIQHKIISFIIIIIIITCSFLFKGIVHWSDILRFKNEFNITPQIAFYSFYDIWQTKISYVWIVELIMVSMGIILYIVMAIKHKENYLWLFIFILLLFPFFKLDTSTIGYRLFMIAYMLFMISIIPKIMLMLEDKWLIIIGMLLFTGTFYSYKSYVSSYFDLPYSNYIAISSIVKEKKIHKLTIAHKGLKEVLVLNNIEATNWDVYDTIKANRIIQGFSLYELRLLTNKEYLGNGYYLTSNKDWKNFCKLKHSNIITDKIHSWTNPSQIKPYFLRKGEK